MTEEIPQVIVVRLIYKPECLDISQICAELSVNARTELSRADLLLRVIIEDRSNMKVHRNLEVTNHLVSVPNVVCLQSHPGQSAPLHEVDQHVADGLEVVPPALLDALVSVHRHVANCSWISREIN